MPPRPPRPRQKTRTLKKPANFNETSIFLDKFTRADLAEWTQFSKDMDEFNVRLFYHLEGLRAFHHKELCESLASVKGVAIKANDWCRIVDFQYSDHPLSAKGSVIKGGRFNIGNNLDGDVFSPFPALYIAEDEDTAEIEKFGAKKSSTGLESYEVALVKKGSYSKLDLNFELGNIFDLTNAANLNDFVDIISKFKMPAELVELAKRVGLKPPLLVRDAEGLKATLITHTWQYSPSQFGIPANSQIFGRILKEAGFEGVLYPSSKKASRKCVAIFTENLDGSDSFIELANPAPSSIKIIRLDSKNWKAATDD